MKIIDKLPYFIVAAFAWIVIISSCANQGMPTGGPKDTIPPVLIHTEPDYKALNYEGGEVRLTFNEFIIPDAVSEKLVVSPPLEKRPTILTKLKTLIIRFNEELKDSTTYSLDFKNSVVDNNERNPLENLRFSFSTGDVYDSLRVAGKVLNSF
ncbi:MAG: Ig-like domain-containing protein, partial [Tangfeifania sp.]